ncbi:MAG: histidine phosphatase family protein [Nitrososphaeria archaeon]|jgi:probable phosphoglycerate mutase
MSEKKLVGLVVRHGDTEVNESNQFRGRLDPSLNAKGVAQAEKAAKNIAREHKDFVKKIVSSPMLRSVQTADILAEELKVEVTQDRGLISWALGFLAGKDRDEYQPILDLYIDNPKLAIPDGEALDDLETRIQEFFDKELRTEGTVYVSHNSNLVTLENLVRGNKDGRPESSETSVEPGGIIGVYVDPSGKYSTDVLFGVEKQAEYAS